jgi:Ca2+-binding EF-hand superfamily protein
VFDKDRNEYLDNIEFIDGIYGLYTQNYDYLTKLIFDFYDFDKDGKISREDVNVVLSYIPLNTKHINTLKMKFEK